MSTRSTGSGRSARSSIAMRTAAGSSARIASEPVGAETVVIADDERRRRCRISARSPRARFGRDRRAREREDLDPGPTSPSASAVGQVAGHDGRAPAASDERLGQGARADEVTGPDRRRRIGPKHHVTRVAGRCRSSSAARRRHELLDDVAVDRPPRWVRLDDRERLAPAEVVAPERLVDPLDQRDSPRAYRATSASRRGRPRPRRARPEQLRVAVDVRRRVLAPGGIAILATRPFERGRRRPRHRARADRSAAGACCSHSRRPPPGRRARCDRSHRDRSADSRR